MSKSTDAVLAGFLGRQFEQATALAAESDVLKLHPLGAPPFQQYIAEFRCVGAVRGPGGQVMTRKGIFAVHLLFPDDYLRRAEVGTVVSWLEPRGILHPNIRPPFVCVGHLMPGTTLVDLLFQIFEMITYTRFTPREDDALNKEACAWARANLGRFPLDRTPLRKRRVQARTAAVPA